MANDRWTDDWRRRWGDDRDRYGQRHGRGGLYSGESEGQDYRDRDYRDQDYGRETDYRDRSSSYGDPDFRSNRGDYRRYSGRDDQYGRDFSRGSDYGYGSSDRSGLYGSGYGRSGDYGGGGYRGDNNPSYGSGSGSPGEWFNVGRNSSGDWAGAYNQSWGRREFEERSGARQQRPLWDRTRDEVRSWMGDEEAERRRQRDNSGDRGHYGRAPRGYTRSDERIREDINDRLTDDSQLDATDIEVKVSSCEVTLNGTVDGRYAKRRAEDIAESVSGVRHVQNNLRVRDRSGMNVSTESSSSTTGSTTTQGRH